MIERGVERPFPLSAALTRGQVAFSSHMLLSQPAQILSVCHAAGKWLSYTKSKREPVSFPDIFKDQKNTWLETQGFSEASPPTRLGGTKLKQLPNTSNTQLAFDLGPIYGLDLPFIHLGDS